MSFLDELKKKLHGVEAQANPFDNGQTYSTVVNKTPVPTPKPAAAPAPAVPTPGADHRSFFSRAFDQVNPLDNGLTFKQPTPTKTPSSVFHQATHSGAANVVGGTVKSVPQLLNTANLGAHELYDTGRMIAANVSHNPDAFTHANTAAMADWNNLGRNNSGLFGQGTVFHTPEEAKSGSLKIGLERIGGNTLQNASLLAAPGAARAAESVAGRILPDVIPRLAPKVTAGVFAGAATGAPANVGANLQGEDNPTLAHDVKAAKEGAIAGAALGGVAEATPFVARASTNLLKAATDRLRGADEATATPLAPAIGEPAPTQSAPTAPTEAPKATAPAQAVTPHQTITATANHILDTIGHPDRLPEPAAEPTLRLQLDPNQPPIEIKRSDLDALSRQLQGETPGARGPMSDSEFHSLAQSLDHQQAAPVPEPIPREGLESLNSILSRRAEIVGNPSYRSVDIERQVQQDILHGNTVDDIVTNYQNMTGRDLQTAAKDVSRIAKESGFDLGPNDLTQNPRLGTTIIPTASKNDWGQALLNAKAIRAHLTTEGNRAIEAFRGLDDHDKLLLRNIEKKTVSSVANSAHSPEAFKAAESVLRDYFNLRHAYDHALGIDTKYRANYIRHIFEMADNEANAAGAGEQPTMIHGRSKPNLTPGYTKERANDDALARSVEESLQRDIHGSASNLGQIGLIKGLNEAFDNKVSVGQVARDPETNKNYKQLKILGNRGQELFLPAEIADKVNKRAPASKATGALGLYDKANAGVKYLKLGAGTFHAVTEAFNFLGQQIASGRLFTKQGAAATGRVLTATASKRGTAAVMRHFEDTGTLHKANLAGVTITPEEILGDVNVAAVDHMKKLNPIKAVHDMVFQREIPAQKLSIFEQVAKDLDPMKPEDMAKMRQAANAINHVFGGLNRSVDAITPGTAKLLSRFVLATDFTEAKIRTVADALTKKGPQGNIARQAVIGKTIVAAAPGLIYMAASGQLDWNKPEDIAKKVLDQILDPHVDTPFKTKSGIHRIAKTPETFISEFGRLVTPLFADGADKKDAELTALQHYAAARLSGGLSEGFQLATNKDYQGDPIIARDKNGKVDLAKSGVNVGMQNAPVPLVQGYKAYETLRTTPDNKTSTPAAVAEAAVNTAGFRSTADPHDPRMLALSFQDALVNGADAETKAAWTAIHGKRVDANGQPIQTAISDSVMKRYSSLINNPDMLRRVLTIDQRIASKNKQLGQPSDPFYSLTPKQQSILLVINYRKLTDAKDPMAKVMTSSNADWINKFYDDRNAYFDSLNLKGTTPKVDPIVKFPTPSDAVQTKLDKLNSLNNSADRAKFLEDNADISDYFNAYDQAVRKQHDYFNEPQYKDYPKMPAGLTQEVMDEYSALPKGTGARSTWIKNNPDKYKAMNEYFGEVSLYNLLQDSQQAQFEGHNFTQKGYKAISSLGQYDIVKDANGQYSFQPGAASGGSGGYGHGGGGRKKSGRTSFHVKTPSLSSLRKLLASSQAAPNNHYKPKVTGFAHKKTAGGKVSAAGFGHKEKVDALKRMLHSS